MQKCSMPKVYGAVTVGERGQVVIPAGVRKSYRISPGDKLIVFAKSGGPIAFIPAEHFNQFLDQTSEVLAMMRAGKIEKDRNV